MIAATIGTGRYLDWARRAAMRVAFGTGLQTVVLDASCVERFQCAYPHHLKFHLFEALDLYGHSCDEVLFFDADAVLMRSWHGVQNLAGHSALVASSSPRLRASGMEELFTVPPNERFDSGLMVLTRRYHEEFLKHGLDVYERIRPKDPSRPHLKDLPALNIARLECRVPLVVLPRRFHFCDYPESTDLAKEHCYFAHFNMVSRQDKEPLAEYWEEMDRKAALEWLGRCNVPFYAARE